MITESMLNLTLILSTKDSEDSSTDWFYGIEESPIELKNRYNKQEESIRGWDDF